VKNFVEEGLQAEEVIVLVGLDVKDAFDAAWWPNILKSLQDCGCPRNLYYLTKSYLSQRTAILSTNSIRMEKERPAEDAPRGHVAAQDCGTFSTIHYEI